MIPSIPPLALLALRVASPAVALLGTLALVPLRPAHDAEPSDVTAVVVATRTPRRAAILALLSLTGLTFLLDGLNFVVLAVINKAWPKLTGIELAALLGLVGYGGMAALGAWKDVNGVNVWERRRVRGAVAIALALDIAVAVLSALSIRTHGGLSIPHWPFASQPLSFVFTVARILLLIPLLATLAHPRVAYTSVISDIDDSAPTASSLLLPHSDAGAPSTGLSPLAAKDGSMQYGTFRSTRSTGGTMTGASTPAQSTANLPATKSMGETKEISLDPSWREIRQRIHRIAPHLWPSKSKSLQLLAFGCFVLLAFGRVVNYFLPQTLGKLIDVLSDGQTPWVYLLIYVGLRYLQSSGGIAALRDILWAPVMQYSDREMSQLSFDHLLNLSLAFHTRRKTGEVLRILDRGAAINRIFELLLFQLVPILGDITIALVVFVVQFDWTLALVIFFDMVAYMVASVVLTRYRTKLRRQMNDRDVITRGIHTDCLLNYETVKYFNGEQHEGERYADAIRQYQALEYRVITSLNVLNLVQNLIIALGLLVGSMIVALRVTRGQAKASSFIIFITYIGQLYGPLAMLGSLYRSINQGLVDTEKLLKLLNEPTDVNDKPGAPDLVVTDGEIEFDNVNFSYDGRTTALNGVSFKVPKGSSVALVGESGSGKSTVLRLLYRFYDLREGEGRILIDGQDIRDITQGSLRRAIGVVPQDSVLFNASIEYNIGYGKFGSTTDEIEAAAKAAQMHDRILTFPDGYDTKVGERGVRLSGGEKQRVAIARTLLKNPPILLLDEATSALDTSTEKDIQKALQNLVKGRSSLSIAHRLSTIASADVILVLKDGQIAEAGSHAELVAKNGIFAAMWADQVGSDDGGSSHAGDANGDVKESNAGYEAEPESQESTRDRSEATPSVAEDKPSYATILSNRLSKEPVADSPSGSSTALAPEASAEAKGAEAPSAPAAEAESANVPAAVPAPTADAPAPEVAPAPIAFPSSPTADDDEPEDKPAPVSFPAADPTPDEPATQPIGFPKAKSDDTASQAPSGVESPPVATPGVTFSPEAASPRSGTPDPSTEPKRRRISSQNFQRLARRISISRRQDSSSSIANLIPALRRGDSTPSGDKDKTPRDSISSEPAPSAAAGQSESSTPSEAKDGKKDKKDKKKDKKDKRKTLV